jgi:hypothetical protein
MGLDLLVFGGVSAVEKHREADDQGEAEGLQGYADLEGSE